MGRQRVAAKAAIVTVVSAALVAIGGVTAPATAVNPGALPVCDALARYRAASSWYGFASSAPKGTHTKAELAAGKRAVKVYRNEAKRFVYQFQDLFPRGFYSAWKLAHYKRKSLGGTARWQNAAQFVDQHTYIVCGASAPTTPLI